MASEHTKSLHTGSRYEQRHVQALCKQRHAYKVHFVLIMQPASAIRSGICELLHVQGSAEIHLLQRLAVKAVKLAFGKYIKV